MVEKVQSISSELKVDDPHRDSTPAASVLMISAALIIGRSFCPSYRSWNSFSGELKYQINPILQCEVEMLQSSGYPTYDVGCHSSYVFHVETA